MRPPLAFITINEEIRYESRTGRGRAAGPRGAPGTASIQSPVSAAKWRLPARYLARLAVTSRAAASCYRTGSQKTCPSDRKIAKSPGRFILPRDRPRPASRSRADGRRLAGRGGGRRARCDGNDTGRRRARTPTQLPTAAAAAATTANK